MQAVKQLEAKKMLKSFTEKYCLRKNDPKHDPNISNHRAGGKIQKINLL